MGFMLRDISRLLRRTFQQRMQDMELTFDQVRVLAYISRNEGIRQVALADMLEVQPITLVHHIDQLAAKGLVERRPDPADRRAYQLYLTHAATPYLVEMNKLAGEIQAKMLCGLSEQQVAMLSSGLSIVRDNLASHQ